MKHMIKYILIFVLGGMVLSSCENMDTNFDLMTNDYDKNGSTYFIQFLNASASYETAIDENGEPTDIVTTVGVALLGPPQSSDVSVTMVVDGSSTMSPNMYTLSSNSVVIPAGGTSGSVTLTALAAEMPEDEVLTLVLNMDAGGAEASSAYQLDYSLKRIKFCPWAVDDMVGSYTGSDEGAYSGGMTAGLPFEVFKVDDTHIEVSGLGGHQWGVWGETVTAGDRVLIEVLPNGTVTFENQFLCTTDDIYDYYMGPSGETAKWDGCTMTFTIPWIYHWDDAYGDNMVSLSVFSKN